MKSDIAASLVILTVIGILYRYLSMLENIKAILFPMTVIAAIGILASALLIHGALSARKLGNSSRPNGTINVDESETIGKNRSLRSAAICYLFIVFYVVIAEKLGFYVSAFLFFVSIICFLDRDKWTLKRGVRKIGIALIFISVLLFLFNKLLLVQTPTGILM